MIDARLRDNKAAQLESIRITKARTSRLNIRVLSDGTVSVKTPHWLPTSKIRQILLERREWIVRQQMRHDQLYGFSENRLTSKTRIYFKRHNREGYRVIKTETALTVLCPEKANDSNWSRYFHIRDTIQERLKTEAQAYLPHKIEEVAAQHQIVYSAVRLKFMLSRWGSCNQKGDLVFNTQIMRLPERLRHYVVCHELVHTLHMNHGRAFHMQLELLAPGSKKLSRELARHQLLE